jgi:hypothetical protein
MPVDFLEVRHRIKEIGQTASQHNAILQAKLTAAQELLDTYAQHISELRQKVERAAQEDPFLRCARPVNEGLKKAFPTPPLPEGVTVLAADGSQISPDRHAALQYYLINVGSIEIRLGLPQPPLPTVKTSLYYGDELYTTQGGLVTEEEVALLRDRRERELLAELAEIAAPPVITLTDGPLELWGSQSQDGERGVTFSESLKSYQKSLHRLCALGAAAGGYVDKPRAELVVQLLEVAYTPEVELKTVRKARPLRGVTDADLYDVLLRPGERSAVFAIQSKSSSAYTGELALHFFYLNVGRENKPWLARVEIPAWVLENPAMLDTLHAVLIQQCRTMGTRPYPYLLHRAHETAVVTLEEKEQVTQMLALELRQRGAPVGEQSAKQFHKEQAGRTRL